MTSCTIHIKDEVNINLSGLETATRRKLEKEFKSLNEPLDEAAYIAKLAHRVAGVSVLNKQNQDQDVLNLKKLAGI